MAVYMALGFLNFSFWLACSHPQTISRIPWFRIFEVVNIFLLLVVVGLCAGPDHCSPKSYVSLGTDAQDL